MHARIPAFAALVLAGAALVVVARGQGENQPVRFAPPVGAVCDVQLRRDAMGLASRMLVSPSTDSVAAAETGITGLFSRMDERWLVLIKLDTDESEVWIPREAILTMEIVGK